MRYNQKMVRKSSKRAQLWIPPPHTHTHTHTHTPLQFSKFRAFRMLHPTKQHVFLEVLVENKALYFSKMALHAGTTNNI